MLRTLHGGRSPWTIHAATWALVVLGSLGSASVALAQDDFADDFGPEGGSNPSEEEGWESPPGTDDEQVPMQLDGAAAGPTGAGATEESVLLHPEEAGESYYFLGLSYRHLFLPKFMLELFTEDATGTANASFGLSAEKRMDGFSTVINVWWAGYNLSGPFRAIDDPVQDTEILESDLSVLWITGNFLWSVPIVRTLDFEWGLGVGLGYVMGDIVRTEAYKDANGKFRKCPTETNAPPNPNPDPFYCEPFTGVEDGEDGAHYNAKVKRWTEGGGLPNVMPWFAIPQIGLRYKPIDQLVVRAEFGLGIGMYTGLSALYGF